MTGALAITLAICAAVLIPSLVLGTRLGHSWKHRLARVSDDQRPSEAKKILLGLWGSLVVISVIVMAIGHLLGFWWVLILASALSLALLVRYVKV
jgi:hypothetical protein